MSWQSGSRQLKAPSLWLFWLFICSPASCCLTPSCPWKTHRKHFVSRLTSFCWQLFTDSRVIDGWTAEGQIIIDVGVSIWELQFKCEKCEKKARLTPENWRLAGAFVPLSFSRPVCVIRQLDGELIRARITKSSSCCHQEISAKSRIIPGK